MTATATPPTGPALGARDPAGARPPVAPVRRPARATLRVPAEVALCLVTAAAALSFNRLFLDSSFLPPVLLALGLSHLLAVVLRRSKVPVGLAALVSVVAMVVVCTWIFYWSTTRFGLPTSLTWETFTTDLREAVDRFREDQAPVEAVRGFVAGSAIGFWLVAFLGDWSAFRLWAPVEATIPAGSLFVFASLLGADRSRTVVTTVFFLAAVGFLLLHRVARMEVSPSWVRGDGRRGARSQLAMGGGIIVVAVVAVALVGPLLPGASSDALLDVKDIGNENDMRITVSPLVDIKQRLVNQSETEVFRVATADRQYWRLTALDEFDGRTWRSSKRFEKVEGQLPGDGLPRIGDSRTVLQTFEVSRLAQIWLPAAFEARSISGLARDVRWEPGTSTLIVDEETSDGMTYQVSSVVTNYEAADLEGLEASVPAEVSEEYLTLPREFPDAVREEARRIVDAAGAGSPYQLALALQDHFQSTYTYDVNATGGQDIQSIEDFLFGPLKAGYCEQFAGTFAAMARSLGLPTRVAVGFTPGDPDPENPDTFVVKGRHAHAWPEVYLAGAGWVLFEPTPGRGAPSASYTGVPEAQDSVTPDSTTSSTTPAEVIGEAGLPFEELPGGSSGGGLAEDGLTGSSTQERTVDGTGARVVLVLLLLVVAYVVGVPLVHVARRRLRRSRARTTAAQVDVAWDDATDALGLLGVRPRVGETPTEFAVRADHRSRAGSQVRELAALTTVARYAPDAPDGTVGSRAATLADGITRAVRDQTTAGERLREVLDPRPLLRRWSTAFLHTNRADGDTDEARARLLGSADGTGGGGLAAGGGRQRRRGRSASGERDRVGATR